MKQIIRGITLHRPWGSAITQLGKDVENRTHECPLPVGSYFAIHSGTKWDAKGQETIEQISGKKVRQVDEIAGYIVATAKFAGNITKSESPWFVEGSIGWLLTDVVAINPIPARGQQGCWELSSELLQRIREAHQSAVRYRDLCTFGHGERPDYQDLIKCFETNGISTLVDVRLEPRNWESVWDEHSISKLCLEHGVNYQAIRDMGNISETSLWVPPDLEKARTALTHVTETLKTKNILILGGDKDHRKCHRSEIAIQIQDRTGCSITHKA